jgi:hypothetical protein
MAAVGTLRKSTYTRLLIAAVTLLILNTDVGLTMSTQVSERDRQLQQKWDTWYARQFEQDCVPRPYDSGAVAAVQRGHSGEPRQFVYGPADPYKRRTPVLQNLKTRPNPRGQGVLVTGWQDGNRGASADYSRSRSVWLVLDGKVYPVNLRAASDLGRLYDGMPATIQKRAGLVHSYKPGQTMLDQLGIDDQTFERRFSGGNPFPTCQ